jgi:hypothetical protein
MGHRRDRAKAALTAALVVALAAPLACTADGDEVSPSSTETTVDLGDGATLIAPEGSLPDGESVEVSRDDPPAAPDDRTGLSEPLDVSLSGGGQPIAPVTLEYPYNPAAVPDGLAPDDVFGVSTYDDELGQWTPLPVSFDEERAVMIATTASFSWKWPWQWDWTGIGAQINQTVGRWLGGRGPDPRCDRGEPLPDWAQAITSAEPGIALRSCAEGEGDTAVVEMVNNRRYGVVLEYGAPVKWAWKEPPADAASLLTAMFLKATLPADRLYIPPLGRATIGVAKGDWKIAVFRTHSTRASIFADFFTLATGGVIEAKVVKAMFGPLVGSCLVPLVKLNGDHVVSSPGQLTAWIRKSAPCLQQAIGAAVSAGLLDHASVGRINSVYGALGRVSLYRKLFDLEWMLVDTWIDGMVSGGYGSFELLNLGPPTGSFEAGIVDESFVGRWSGPVDQPGSRPYDAVVEIEAGAVGSVVGSVFYPGLGCTGELTLLRVESGRIVVHEEIVDDPRFTCVPQGNISLEADGDTLRYHYQSDSDSIYADAILVQGCDSSAADCSAGGLDAGEDSFVGRWSGPVDQPGSRPYDAVVDIEAGAVGSVVGSVFYPGLGCTGELTLLRVESGRIVVHEEIVDDPRFTCVPQGNISLEADGDTLRYHWRGGGTYADAILVRD